MRASILLLVGFLVVSFPVEAQFVASGGVIPVVANNPGENATYWRSDVSILNTGADDTTVTLMLFPEIIAGQPNFDPPKTAEAQILAGRQKTLSNVVQSTFGLLDKKGALWVVSSNFAPLVISSRVYTSGDQDCEGSYGQDVDSVLVTREAWASGLEHDGFYRTNIGVFLPIDPLPGEVISYEIEIYEADGELAGSGRVEFRQAGLQQKSLSSFGVENLFDGYAVLRCSDTTLGWYAYASTVDQTSGDAVFRIARGAQTN